MLLQISKPNKYIGCDYDTYAFTSKAATAALRSEPLSVANLWQA